ncbi:MAG TPA: toll/interleukin-1 receptor domain-containing protein, partial [Planctomycetaceae bacterium]
RRVKEYVATESRSESQLIPESALYSHFLQSRLAKSAPPITRAEFRQCLDRLEAHGLIRWLPFGDLILLQPEVLDKYASALVIEAKNDPTGLGCISEERARNGDFKLEPKDRLEDRRQESLLLIAVVEALLQHELAFRLPTDDGTMLVFPTQLTRELPASQPLVTYAFAGPVNSIYATLAVRLVYSGLFAKHETWKNAVQFAGPGPEKYELRLRDTGQGKAELELTAFKVSHEDIFDSFDRFVFDHLMKRALPVSMARKRHFVCPSCNAGLTPDQIEKRRGLGFDAISCPVCDTAFSIVDKPPESVRVEQLSRQAAENRDRQISKSMIEGKEKCGLYDVFLAYNSRDKKRVTAIYDRLLERGIRPWFDSLELRPGDNCVSRLSDVLDTVKLAAIFVGPHGIGRWQTIEIGLLVTMLVEAQVRIIPVLLEGATDEPDWNKFLRLLQRVDFRAKIPDPFEQLVYGITGRRPDGLK